MMGITDEKKSASNPIVLYYTYICVLQTRSFRVRIKVSKGNPSRGELGEILHYCNISLFNDASNTTYKSIGIRNPNLKYENGF